MILAAQLCILFCLNTAPAPVIDSTCDLKTVKLPMTVRAQCIDESTGQFLPNLTAEWRAYCVNTVFNNRLIKKRCEAKP
jgi:hypothetical protein